MTSHAELRKRFQAFGQEHVFAFWDQLSESERRELTDDLSDIDLELLSRLIDQDEAEVDPTMISRQARGITAEKWDPLDDSPRNREARSIGEQMLSAGEVAVAIVAGGQGTRLGFDRPKGLFPIGPVSQRTLFAMLFDMIRARRERYGAPIPTLVMTSDATDAETRAHFNEQGQFGLPLSEVQVFRQGLMPIVDAATGKLLLASRSRLATSPDGHGGMLAAMVNQGLLDRLADQGVRELFYCQVDNPMVDIAAPEILGLHRLAQADLTTMVVRKRNPTERVGNVVRIGDSMRIVEYSDLPADVAAQRNAQGELEFWAGNTAIHVMSIDFLKRAAADASSLPFHRAIKSVPRVEPNASSDEPTSGEGIKFERFIFDLMPFAVRPWAIEIEPQDLFAPVKNAAGAPSDTPETSRQAILSRARRWLRAAGVPVDETVDVEIAPSFALDPGQLAVRKTELPKDLAGCYLV